MRTVKLVSIDKALCIPPQTENGLHSLLLHFYPEGDCDVFHPLTFDIYQLLGAMFDARECGEVPADCDSFELPNGDVYYF